MTTEYQDIVNDNDKVVGTDTRNHIWQRGLQHNVRVINIFIKNEHGKILVPKRSASRSFAPNTYDFSCGENVLTKETYLQAAKRGLKEELGISTKLIKLGKLTPKDGVNCFMEVFCCNYNKQISIPSNNEVASLYWFSPDQIESMLNQNSSLFKPDYLEVFNKFKNILRRKR